MRGFFSVFALVSVVVAVTACAPGVQPLLEEYNALFPRVTERGQEAAGGGDGWLADLYEFSIGGHLNLHAPEHCSSYRWELREVPGSNSPPIPHGFDPARHGGDTLYFSLRFKDVGFAVGGYYELVCTVVKDGRTMQDSCRIKLVD